jgi:hypothetical protein
MAKYLRSGEKATQPIDLPVAVCKFVISPSSQSTISPAAEAIAKVVPGDDQAKDMT